MLKVIRVKVVEVVRRNVDPRLDLPEKSYYVKFQYGGWFTKMFPGLCGWDAVIEHGCEIIMEDFKTFEAAKRKADSMLEKPKSDTDVNTVYEKEAE